MKPSNRTNGFWPFAKKRLGRDHPDVATALNDLAGLYDDQGRYADRAIVPASVGHSRKGARPRSSRCCDGAE